MPSGKNKGTYVRTETHWGTRRAWTLCEVWNYVKIEYLPDGSTKEHIITLFHPIALKTKDLSKYKPHQGAGEVARRRKRVDRLGRRIYDLPERKPVQ